MLVLRTFTCAAQGCVVVLRGILHARLSIGEIIRSFRQLGHESQTADAVPVAA